MKVGIGLYVRNSAAAVAFYQEVFRLELGYHVKNPDGSYFHSELCRDGEAVLSVVESPSSAGGSAVELGIEFAGAQEVREAFAKLSQNGTVLMEVCELPWSPCAAVVVDRFGIRWYITAPQHRPPESFSPERQG